MTRVGIFGWGVVAPKSPDIEAFRRNLESCESWLTPFNGFGPDCFLVGQPAFRFQDYRGWIDKRFSPNRFQKLDEKMDLMTKYAIGAFIQSLQQNQGLEEELRKLGSQARVYIGTGISALPTVHDQTLTLYRAQRRWDRFWADPERNSALRAYLKGDSGDRSNGDPPIDPEQLACAEREEAESAWWHFWAECSPDLQQYLSEVRDIEGFDVEGDVESGKMSALKRKRRLVARLQKKWGAPEPPWNAVSSDLIWNIPNTPAAQISMLGKITGMSFAPAAACSTFGVALRLACDAIRARDAKVVVVGAADPPPHPLTVAAFYRARVISADGAVSKPLSGLRGTHISGGAVLWIVGDFEYLTARGFRPLGMELLSVGVTSDADHIITPSKEGPIQSIREALEQAHVDASEIGTWDLHATATPGDYLEVATLRDILPESVLVTARKGTFGHGMSAGGGWELTAQFLGYERGNLFPTPLNASELNAEIAKTHRRFVFDAGCAPPAGIAGKLSMGIGGINACVLSRPLSDDGAPNVQPSEAE